jgi:hypothetical protein
MCGPFPLPTQTADQDADRNPVPGEASPKAWGRHSRMFSSGPYASTITSIVDSFFAAAVLAALGHVVPIRRLVKLSIHRLGPCSHTSSIRARSPAQASASVYLLKTASMRSHSWSNCSCRTLFLAWLASAATSPTSSSSSSRVK